MPITEDQVQAALKKFIDPNTGKDYVASRSARNIKIDGDKVSLDIELGYPAKTQIEPVRKEIETLLRAAGAAQAEANVYS